VTRRGLLKWLGGLALAGASVGTYALVIEPGFLLRTQYYALTPPNWTPGLKLRLVLIADPHLGEPYMSLGRWNRILNLANSLEGDLNLLLGDYAATHRFVTSRIAVAGTARAAKKLTSRLGTYAIIGNHDWWSDAAAQSLRQGPTRAQRALEDAGIPVLENKVQQLAKDSLPFWLSGTASMVAIKTEIRGRFEGRDNLAGALAQITDDAPVIHLAHEPDLFTQMPPRVSLTLSGHTHGGQVRLFGWSPIVPSEFGNRFAYGHIIENGRHLIVSGGLGCSVVPVRFGVPPEITVVDLTG
jgi:predicted MPP superfamily phosphohydrolase